MKSTMVLKIIVGLIIFLYALRGLRKGFIRTLMSMAFLIMAAALVYFANPAVSSFLKEKTPVYEVLQDKCEDIFSLKNLSRLQGGKEISNEKDTETEPTRIEQAKIIGQPGTSGAFEDSACRKQQCLRVCQPGSIRI